MKPRICPHCELPLDGSHSDPERRRHFAVIREAWKQWPANIRLQDQLTGPEDLRAWLYVTVGHADSMEIDLADDPAGAVDGILRFAGMIGHKVFVRIQGTRGKIFIARSIRKKDCPHEKLWRIIAAVDEEIERRIGVSADKILEEKGRAA